MTEQAGTRRILVADDDPERLKALVERLQREGFQVLTAQDGLEALDRAREELPDAIVLNLLLRRIDGLRVCEILKSNPATTNIPVLLIAGVHVDADEGKRALAAGADRFLSDLGPLSTGSGRELGAGQDLIQAVRTLLGAEPELELRPILLAIDDDPDNRAFLTKAVSKQGFEVVTAPNATQARRQLDGRRPALIFLDVQMPEESGLALLPQMLRDFPDAVVVMMTAYGSEQVAAEALRGGADDYIAKPIDLQRLRELLERNLEKQRLRAERQSLVARLKDSNRYLMRQHAALRRADEEILQVNRQLEQSNRYKSEFLANMSHELRTPLNAILGFSEILLDLTMNLTPGERTEFLRNIHSSGQHLLGLINDILDLAKIEAGKMELKAEDLRVSEALQEVTAILEPMARQQGLQLITIGAVEASVIKADRSKFKQVLYNLLSNAVKFTPPPGQITITVKDAPDQLTVSVQDTGIGMKGEDLPKLFREFEQIDGSYTRRYHLGGEQVRQGLDLYLHHPPGTETRPRGRSRRPGADGGEHGAAAGPGGGGRSSKQPADDCRDPGGRLSGGARAGWRRGRPQSHGNPARPGRDGNRAAGQGRLAGVAGTPDAGRDGGRPGAGLLGDPQRAADGRIRRGGLRGEALGHQDDAGRAPPGRPGHQAPPGPGAGADRAPRAESAGAAGGGAGRGGVRSLPRPGAAGGPGEGPGGRPGRGGPGPARAGMGAGTARTARPAGPAGPGRSFTQGASDGLERRYTIWPLPARCRIARHQGAGHRSEAKEDRP